jgi:hypothetical protein
MTLNKKLTSIIKRRAIDDLQITSTGVSIRFSDGSTMHIKIAAANSPPLKNGARISAVSEQSAALSISCEDQSELSLILADPGSSVSVRDKNGKLEYLG